MRALLAGGGVVSAGLRVPGVVPFGARAVVTGDLAAGAPVLSGYRAVIHVAGLAHRRGASAAEYRAANVEAAVKMAQSARWAGVERFVLISSVSVYGAAPGGVVTEATPVNPAPGYAASKLAAEHAVAAIFPALTIIRPVAVIGPGCPGNLEPLMRLLRTGLPLPFGGIGNARSFIDVEDLALLVQLALALPPQLMIAAHPVPISTPALLRALAVGLERPARLMAFPPALLKRAAGVAGRAALWQSLAGDFIARPEAALAAGWQPGRDLVDTFTETSRYYNTTRVDA